MAKITIDEGKLEEIIEAAVDRRLQEKRFISLDDVEAVRRSPAGAMLIIENDVQWLKVNSATKEDIKELRGEIGRVAEELHGEIGKVAEELHGEIGRIDEGLRGEIGKVAEELHGEIGRVAGELRGEIGKVAEELGGGISGVSKGLGGRISSVEGKLGILIGLYFALLALFGSVAVKVFFFMP